MIGCTKVLYAFLSTISKREGIRKQICKSYILLYLCSVSLSYSADHNWN